MASRPPADLNDPVGAFMARVLDDPAAQARLAVPFAMEDYVPLAIDVARDYGIALSAAELDRHLHSDALGLGLGRFGPAPVTLDRWPGEGWVPVRSVPGDAEPAFDWAWFGDAAFSGSFFEDAVAARRRCRSTACSGRGPRWARWLAMLRTTIDRADRVCFSHVAVRIDVGGADADGGAGACGRVGARAARRGGAMGDTVRRAARRSGRCVARDRRRAGA